MLMSHATVVYYTCLNLLGIKLSTCFIPLVIRDSIMACSSGIQSGIYESYIDLETIPSPKQDEEDLPPVNLWQLAEEGSVVPLTNLVNDDM